MCQFCGVDPEFASFFDKQSNTTTTTTTTTSPSSGANYFRMKPDHPRYTKLTTPQLTTFASKLSPSAKVLLASHQGDAFEKASQRWSNQAVKTALAIVQVATPEDVSKTIILATSHDVPFVIKCGGHSPSGASSVENGVVIDLGLMRQVSVKPEEQLVIADGGCLYSDVCKAAADYGLACVGGTTSHVGVGGLALSGGYGYLSGEYGLATDNIVGAQVVTADGKILMVNDKEHADLFWGLRGAGNRLVAVTKFIFKAHRLSGDQVWGGMLQFSGQQVEAVIEALNVWYNQKDVKAAAELALGTVDDGQPGLTVHPFYNGSISEAESSFAGLLALPSLKRDVSAMPFWKINTLSDGPLTGVHIEFDSANIKPPLCVDHMQRLLTALATVDGWNAGVHILLVQPDGVMKQRATDMAFPWRDDHFDVGVNVAWQQPDVGSKATEWLHSVFQPLTNAQGQQGRLYSNHSDFKGPAAMEFGANAGQVQALKSQWDPKDVFKSLL